MGIQINGQNDTISAIDGSLNLGGTVTVNVTGDATGLSGTPNINVGVLTAASAVISGNLQVDGTTTTLDTLLTEVDKLEVGANNTTVGVAITQSGIGDILRLYDGASQVVTVKDGGSVGIGTDAPGSKLHIISTNNVPARFESPTADSFINFVNTQDTNGYIGYETEAFTFYTNNTEKLRITSGGNVGIGLTNPQNLLHIKSGTSGASSYDSRYKLILENSGEQYIGFYNNDNSFSGIRFNNTTTNLGTIDYYYTQNYLYYYANGGHVFTTKQGGGTAERVRITSGGNVGIGTTNPDVALHILSNTTGFKVQRDSESLSINPNYAGQSHCAFELTNALSIRTGSGANNERLRITSAGKIGINTSTPIGDVTIYTTNNGYIDFSGSGGKGAEITFRNRDDKSTTFSIQNNGGSNELAQYVLNSASATHIWYCGGQSASHEKLRLTSNGRLGIGTDNPSTYKLDINHLHTEQGLRVRSRYGNIATAMVKFDTDPTSDGGDGNVLHIHGGNSRTDSEIVTIDGTGPGNILHVRGDGLIRTYKNVELQNASLLVTGNSSYDQQTSIYSYNTHSATGHRPVWNTFVKFIVTSSAGTQLRIPLVYQGNYWTRTLLRGYGISAQYNSANPKPFSFTCGFGHLTTFNSVSNIETTGNLASISYTNGTNSSNPPTVNLNFTSAYTGATNQGVDLYLEWFTAIPAYSVQPDLINLN